MQETSTVLVNILFANGDGKCLDLVWEMRMIENRQRIHII